MDPLVILGALGSVAAIVSAVCDVISVRRGGGSGVESQGRLYPRRTYLVMAAFLLLIWGAVVFNYYDRRQYGSLVNVMTGWGGVAYKTSGEPDVVLTRVDGGRLLAFQRKYRVVVVCFPYDGEIERGENFLVNALDVANLQKSAAHEIRNEEMDIIFHFDNKFVAEWKSRRKGTWYVLFLIPRNVEVEYFSTIRQALAFGLIPLQTSYGQP